MWVENVLPVEENSSIVFSEVFIFELLYKISFKSSYYLINGLSYFSLMDSIILENIENVEVKGSTENVEEGKDEDEEVEGEGESKYKKKKKMSI